MACIILLVHRARGLRHSNRQPLANGFEDVFTDRLPTGARIRYLAPKDPAAKASMVEACGAGFLECVEIVPGRCVLCGDEASCGKLVRAANWTKDTKSY
jgi:hypothetical protein